MSFPALPCVYRPRVACYQRFNSLKFIDRLRIFIKAGSGAAGNPKVRSKGGNGGSIFLKAQESATLDDIVVQCPIKRFKAGHGSEVGVARYRAFGTDGQNLVIKVPVGVTVTFAGQGTSSKSGDPASFTKLGDLNESGQSLLVAQGGHGGSYRNGYIGSPGQAHSIQLDLKLMSDYALIGFPNAGKSSLLKAISGVNAKIASYPFTTLQPQIAHSLYPDRRRISLTDLPGLADIYAKYDGNVPTRQLRHTNFLKHVERCSCLLLVLDSLGFQKDQLSPWRSPLATTYLVLRQLEQWCQGVLIDKPIACVLNKIDLPDALEAANNTIGHLSDLSSTGAQNASGLPSELLPRFLPKFEDIYLISAKEEVNVEKLKFGLRQVLDTIEIRRRNLDSEIEAI